MKSNIVGPKGTPKGVKVFYPARCSAGRVSGSGSAKNSLLGGTPKGVKVFYPARCSAGRVSGSGSAKNSLLGGQ